MFERLKLQAKNIFTWYQATAFPLFLLVILLLVYMIVRLDRGLNFENLRLLALLAAGLGLLLYLLKRPSLLLIFLVSLVSGVAAAFTVIGNLAKPLFELFQTLVNYFSASWRYYMFTGLALPDVSLLQEKRDIFGQAVNVLFERLRTWLTTLPEPAYDPVSLNLIWGMVIWIISIWLFWFVVKKKQVLMGFLPPLIIMAGIFQKIDEGLFTLFFVLGIGLLLAVLSNQARLEVSWYRQGFSFSGMIRKITSQNALVIAVGLVIFASVISSPKLDDFIKDLREKRRQAVSAVPGEDGVQAASRPDEGSLMGPQEVLSGISDGQLPNVHLIGSGPELAETEVFHARIEDIRTQVTGSYYFRSATYETYNLSGWHANEKGYVFFPPEEEFEIDFTPNEKLIFQEVTLLDSSQQGNLMYLVGDLAAANVNYYASYHTKFVNNTFEDLFATVTDSAQYAAYSRTPNYGEEDLRNSSLEYPDWIANKYLQVPDSVPDRVYDLALSLTATQPTQYDRALAIEQYLRNFEYTLDIEDPPAYTDIVDYFLFDLQKGYCDYFASSMVVLARAAGIPARLSIGYLASTYDEESNQYIVTADQAHSWAEVYFNGFGWVTFEPTSGRPALERFEEREELPDELAIEPQLDLPSQDAGPNFSPLFAKNLFVLTGQVVLLLVVGLFFVHWIDRWTLQAMPPERMFARLYRRVWRISKGLGVKVKDTDTPLEFSDLLLAYLGRHRTGRTFSQLIDSAQQNAALIITACNQAAYAKQLPDSNDVRLVISAWGRLRWQLLLIRIFIRLMPVGAEIRRIWTRMQQPA